MGSSFFLVCWVWIWDLERFWKRAPIRTTNMKGDRGHPWRMPDSCLRYLEEIPSIVILILDDRTCELQVVTCLAVCLKAPQDLQQFRFTNLIQNKKWEFLVLISLNTIEYYFIFWFGRRRGYSWGLSRIKCIIISWDNPLSSVPPGTDMRLFEVCAMMHGMILI